LSTVDFFAFIIAIIAAQGGTGHYGYEVKQRLQQQPLMESLIRKLV